MNFTYVDKLEIGDPIIVAESGSFLNFGWFAGYGQNTVQYYLPWAVIAADKTQRENPQKKIRMYKAYVQKTNRHRVAKIQEPVFFEQDDRERYEEARRILIDRGIIKN